MKNTLTLKLIRKYFLETYTIGHLYIEDEYFCDVLEDTDRNIFDEMDIEEIKSKKIYGETAIPYGSYEITMNIKSSKYSNFEKYKWAKEYNGYMPRLLNIKGFDSILIHPGNTEKNTLGCLLVGENKIKGKIINSTNTFKSLMDNFLLPAKSQNKTIIIKIEKASC